jgi:putative peptidoglycan lipid II flippase
MLPRTIGLSIWQINFWINTMICSGLPSGSLSALVISFQIFTFPQAAIAQAIATAVFPTFSKQAALGHTDRMRQSLNSSLRGALYLSIPASAGLYVVGRPIVEMLFQNNTFSVSSTNMVVWALNWYAIGLVSHSVVEIVTRAFYALKDTRTPMIVGGISMILNVALSIVLSRAFLTNSLYPHGGLALANTIATTVEMLALLWILAPRLRGLRVAAVFKSVLITTFGTTVMLIFLYMWLQIVTIPAIVTVLGGITMGICVFWVVTAACGSEEANKIPTIIARQIRELSM